MCSCGVKSRNCYSKEFIYVKHIAVKGACSTVGNIGSSGKFSVVGRDH